MNGLSESSYSKIIEVVRRLENHARSLLMDIDRNVAEHYNAKVAKFIGSKRINFALKNSYSAQCNTAVVSHNTYLDHAMLKNTVIPNFSKGIIIHKAEMRIKRKLALKQMIQTTYRKVKTREEAFR